MTFDLDINEDKDTHLDGANDLALTSGRDRIEQSIGISVMDETQDFIGGRVTGKNVGTLEGAIQEGLRDDNDVGRVIDVNITTFDRNESRVEAEVIVTPDENFTIEVTP